MKLADLLSVGALTGVVGMLTGVYGAIRAHRADRKVENYRRGDRRLELRRLRNDTEVAAESLIALLPRALESRQSALHRRGILKSSITEAFEAAYKNDLAAATRLARSVPRRAETFDSLSPNELDERIVGLDHTCSEIAALAKKYRVSMEEDARWRPDESR